MKQVIFAIALLAMASLTGCLNTDDTSVDETTDTTSDNTGNTNDNSNDNADTNQDNTDTDDNGLIDPVLKSNMTTPDLAEIETLLDSINDKLEELENIATALENSNEHTEKTHYQPGAQSSVSLNNLLIYKDGNKVSIDCENIDVDSGMIIEFYTESQILIASITSAYYLEECNSTPYEMELKREPVLACLAFSQNINDAVTYPDTDTSWTPIYTCNTF